jgi:hypothetical protein
MEELGVFEGKPLGEIFFQLLWGIGNVAKSLMDMGQTW